MSVPVTFKKADLLNALEAKRPACLAADKAAAAKHKKEEEAYLKEFQGKLRNALGWDYATAKKNDFQVRQGDGWRGSSGPHCPPSRERALNLVIASVKNMANGSITVKSTNKYRDIYEVLMADVPAPELCK